jgi:hypothetical protein
MMNKLKSLIKELQDKGIPIIVLRDLVTNSPSITYTFFVLSGILVILGLIGKFARVAGGIDMDNALAFFYACSATYVGRKFTAPSPTLEKKPAKPKSKVVDNEGEDEE